MITNITFTHTPVKSKQAQTDKPAPGNQAATRHNNALRFGQYKPRKDAHYYKNLGLDILDEADELKDEGKAYLKDADRYAREAKKEDKLADNRIALSRQYEKKAQRSFFYSNYQKNRQEALRKKESALFHMNTAEYDAAKAQQYKNIGLNRLDEADELYSEGEELLDVAEDLKRRERQKYTSARRYSEPTASRPFNYSQPQPERHQTTDSYFQSYTNTKFYYPETPSHMPQPQWSQPSWHGHSNMPSGTQGMHRSKSNPIPTSYASPRYDSHDRRESSHFPKSHTPPRTPFFDYPIFEEPVFEEPTVKQSKREASWEYIPADEDLLHGHASRAEGSPPAAPTPPNMSSTGTGKQKETGRKQPESRPFEMPHRFKPGQASQTSGQTSGQKHGGGAPQTGPSPSVKRSSTFTEGSNRPKFRPDEPGEPSGHRFTPPDRSNTAPANTGANNNKGKAKEEVRPYTAEQMKRDEALLREKTRAENRTFQASFNAAERQRENNYTNLSWRIQRRDQVKKFFDTINLPENQRNFENRKAYNTAYKKYMVTHQRYINDPNNGHEAELERFKEMSIFKEELETYMGWFGETLAELSAWEGQDEKTRKPGKDLIGSERFQAYTAGEATILRQREALLNPKPPSKSEKHGKRHGIFRRRTWF